MPRAASRRPRPANAATSMTKNRRGGVGGAARGRVGGEAVLGLAGGLGGGGAYGGGVWEGYIGQPAVISALVSCTSATTPITWASAPPASAMRPMGSSPGHRRRAMVSLMITTACFLLLSSHEI